MSYSAEGIVFPTEPTSAALDSSRELVSSLFLERASSERGTATTEDVMKLDFMQRESSDRQLLLSLSI